MTLTSTWCSAIGVNLIDDRDIKLTNTQCSTGDNNLINYREYKINQYSV
jgi:hypothetical protein